ncbi:hypothetical protein G7046_g8256 [Stylonectria norvegica]|nr:hypothetical protein G7046_g8256 [Stylonectria norvegica]
MDSELPITAAPDAIRFRPGKKRKAYRRRNSDDEDAAVSSTEKASASSHDGSRKRAEAGEDGDDAVVAAALRLRNARKTRARGVGFTTTAAAARADNSEEHALILRGDQDDAPDQDLVVGGITNRFTHQTGLLNDLNDRHMMEYIESHLSKRSAPSDGPDEPQPTSPSAAPATTTAGSATKPEGHAIMQGRLMEIDLGDEARDRNVARTERATGGTTVAADDGRVKRRRLGKDGKPWRSRNRRGSDAIKRDQLVEQILRESRLDVYDVTSSPAATAPGADEDGAADERLAEEFRRQFLDDVAQRQLKKKKPAVPVRPGVGEEVLKGPKAGGKSKRARGHEGLAAEEGKGGEEVTGAIVWDHLGLRWLGIMAWSCPGEGYRSMDVQNLGTQDTTECAVVQ